ncbi:hypothetical protein ACFYSJ_12425 [Streptomyces sp. NPDC005248]|uniref:hypothetical protein n=1 Tax=Streptomyces sp. NPDC005248 TaxID=3364709 RepID=UPI00367B8603
MAAKFTVGYSCDDVTTWHTEPIGGECRDRWPPWEDCDIFGPVTYELKLSWALRRQTQPSDQIICVDIRDETSTGR